MRPEQEIRAAMNRYADMVYRVCFLYLKNHHDVEDVFQEVFLKYALYDGSFDSCEHEKAWLIRVAVNRCKDELKSFFRRRVSSIELLYSLPADISDENKELLNAVKRLPENYRIAIYMFYYEGYTAVEIAKIIGKKENTIYTWLDRGRKKLKGELGGDIVEG